MMISYFCLDENGRSLIVKLALPIGFTINASAAAKYPAKTPAFDKPPILAPTTTARRPKGTARPAVRHCYCVSQLGVCRRQITIWFHPRPFELHWYGNQEDSIRADSPRC